MKFFFAAILCAAAAALLAATFVASSLQDRGPKNVKHSPDVNVTKAKAQGTWPAQVTPARP